jgi:S-adenosylmethionine:tRNA ribosyltransferase-isomerase
VLVFNRTKVIPARVTLIKPTGGRARVLFLGLTRGLWEVLSDRKLDAGSKLLSENAHFIVRQREGKSYFLKPSFPPRHTFSMLARFGKTPLPPYIKRSPLSESKLREKYQTVFAKTAGSVAAPTASLHFSKKLIATLRKNGIAVRFITLHVNLGTFAPLDKKQLKQGKLHSELYEIDASTARFLNKARKEKRPIIAVGTTVVRTLESACGANGHLHALRGATDLFIRGRYCFKAIDGIITNFHVPRSSLLMLVAAFVGREKTLELYRLAIKKRFRLFSFGDGMLLY